MAYQNYYQPNFYSPPMPDQLAQFRQNYQPPMISQPMPQSASPMAGTAMVWVPGFQAAQEPMAYSGGYSQAAGPDTAGDYGDSDFLRAIAGRELPAVFDILDELMETLRVVNTRAYDGVMRRIKSI